MLTVSLAFGGFAQLLAGLWEFVSGNTFGATLLCSYGLFWWGYSIINIPFFGMVGQSYGQPGVYSSTGLGAAEASNAIGLSLWMWFGVTVVFLFAAIRSSVVTILLLLFLAL